MSTDLKELHDSILWVRMYRRLYSLYRKETFRLDEEYIKKRLKALVNRITILKLKYPKEYEIFISTGKTETIKV